MLLKCIALHTFMCSRARERAHPRTVHPSVGRFDSHCLAMISRNYLCRTNEIRNKQRHVSMAYVLWPLASRRSIRARRIARFRLVLVCCVAVLLSQYSIEYRLIHDIRSVIMSNCRNQFEMHATEKSAIEANSHRRWPSYGDWAGGRQQSRLHRKPFRCSKQTAQAQWNGTAFFCRLYWWMCPHWTFYLAIGALWLGQCKWM